METGSCISDRDRAEMMSWVTRFRPKVGQIDPKWDKSGDFFRLDSVHFGLRGQKGSYSTLLARDAKGGSKSGQIGQNRTNI